MLTEKSSLLWFYGIEIWFDMKVKQIILYKIFPIISDNKTIKLN